MDFIREKTKEKPMSKKRFFAKIGIAVLCGVVFSLTVVIVLLFCKPLLEEHNGQSIAESDTEAVGDTERMEGTESQDSTESSDGAENVEGTDQTTQDTQIEAGLVIPPNFSLSISDYQTLLDELYQIGNEANRSIVAVFAMSDEDSNWADNPFEAEGQSSGVIVEEDANYLYILTEKKVLSNGGRVHVAFVDNTGAEAKLLKYDGNTGLAILTVEKRRLNTSTQSEIAVALWGSSYEMTNGAVVIALGSPLGTNYSILTGNITSIQNEIATQDKNYSVFTTDIVASENASGVLVNTKGEIIAVVMQSFSGSQDISTLTAVEVDELKSLIEILSNGKDVPYMGVYVSTVTKEISKEYDIPIGVYIKDVEADSPAMHAGLQSGDVIVKINGEKVSSDEKFSDIISQLIIGTTCEITVKRQTGSAYYDVTCMVEISVLQ